MRLFLPRVGVFFGILGTCLLVFLVWKGFVDRGKQEEPSKSGAFVGGGAASGGGGLLESGVEAGIPDAGQAAGKRLADARKLLSRGKSGDWQGLIREFLAADAGMQDALLALFAPADRVKFEEEILAMLQTGSDEEAAMAIRALGRLGGEENERWLVNILSDDGWPDALRREAAVALLEDPLHGRRGESLLLTAIRGLGILGMDEDVALLASILSGASLPDTLRGEAAVALGRIASDEARDALTAAFAGTESEDLRLRLLAGLGHLPFPAVEALWKDFFLQKAEPSALRAAGAEALAHSTAEAVPLLTELAASDSDPEVREMAAWALSAQPAGGSLGPRLAELVRAEPEPDVRRRFYEAMLVQEQNPAGSLLPSIRNEDDPALLVAALNAVGDQVGRGETASLQQAFETEWIPELISIAESNWSLNLRMRAVFALRRASTAGALQALDHLSRNTTPEIAAAARNGLPSR